PIHIVPMSFGTVREDAQSLNIVPVDSLNDIAGLLRHYRDSASTVSKTGTTCTALQDQSDRAQNATTAGSPVLDDADNPTYVAFDGTNDEASIPTSGVTELQEATIIAVVRKKSSDVGTSGT